VGEADGEGGALPGLAGGLGGPAVCAGELATTVRPMPLPEGLAVRPRKNLSNTRGRSSAGMPGPVSETRITACWPSVVVSTRTRPPWGVYLSALDSRLARICPTPQRVRPGGGGFQAGLQPDFGAFEQGGELADVLIGELGHVGLGAFEGEGGGVR
jgi:hypothetical protein